jgi:hypothetical protein
LSEPAEESGPPAPEPPPSPVSPPLAVPRRLGIPVLIAAGAVLVVIIAIAATPFWAPGIMAVLPWGGPEAKPQAVSPQPAATDPALAATRAQASQAAAAVQQLSQRLAALEARPAPPPPDLSAIERQLGALGKTTEGLSGKVAALDKAERDQPATDPKITAMALALLQIHDAVEIGRPFEAEYRALVALAYGRAEIAAAAAPLDGPAASGVASRATLAARLHELAPQIATAKPPPKATWKSQIVARLRSLVTIRRTEGADQTPAEGAVGAAERALTSGDLAGAVTALDGLSGPSQTAAQPWLQMAKARLAVEAALRQVEAALTVAVGGAAPAGKG